MTNPEIPWKIVSGMTKGINPKKWFYGLHAALEAERDRPCILAGAACEQWINGELFRVIARGLDGTNLTAYPEWNKRQHDVVVMRHDPSSGEAWATPVAVVETKLVYSNYPPSTRRRHLERVIEQLAVHHTASPTRVGVFVAIYAYWPEHSTPKESFAEFRRNVGSLLRERALQGMPGFSITMDHKGSMETVLDETHAKVGAADVVVGCVAQYIRVRPT